MKSELRSFDVFDTVLTRLVGAPSSVFLLLGGRAERMNLWPHSAERFAAARVSVESRARAHVHPAEVTLAEIYQELAFSYGLSAENCCKIATLEIEIEGVLLRAVPASLAALVELRQGSHRVGFISDSYLPQTMISEWLERERLSLVGDSVWVSSSDGLTKASGALFLSIKHNGVETSQWRHLGDHLLSDVAVPRSLGIQAEHLEPCGLTRYESAMELHATSTVGLASLLAGASRWLRLSHPANSAVQISLRDMAGGVAGPVLWSYVTWVLQLAQRDGLRRVWFTARDGQIMLKMAKRIVAKLGLNLELGYLYGGRQVVHLAGLRKIDEPALKWLTGGAAVVTADALLERVGLQSEDLGDALQRHGLPTSGVLGWNCTTALRNFFMDAVVETAILRVAARRRADVHSYFQACGLIGGTPCAVVDIGWRGSVLRSMFDIIGAHDAGRHRFLYFGLFGRPGDVPEAQMSAYCFDASNTPHLGVGYDVPSLTSVMEIFCQADHPQVLHVERCGDDHVPKLRAPPVSYPTLWEVSYFQECLEAFAECVAVDLVVDVDADLRPLCERVLRLLMTNPSRAEATVLGSVQYVDDQSGTTAQPFAQAYRHSDWRELARTGKLPQKTLAWWENGAWALTPATARLNLRVARKIGKWRRRSTVAGSAATASSLSTSA